MGDKLDIPQVDIHVDIYVSIYLSIYMYPAT